MICVCVFEYVCVCVCVFEYMGNNKKKPQPKKGT